MDVQKVGVLFRSQHFMYGVLGMGTILESIISLPSNSDSMKRDPRNRTLGVAEKKGNKKGF